jgi:hypothetical protein
MDNVKKPNISEYYTQSSGTFRIYKILSINVLTNSNDDDDDDDVAAGA